MTKLLRQLLALSLLLLMSVAVLAQSTNAAITGQVVDPNKAFVPQVKVRAINNNTNVRYEGATNQAGLYLLPSLPPGEYRIEVDKAGFRSIIKPNIVLHVQDRVELNFELALGSASESITVQGEAPLINTQDAGVSAVVDRQFIQNMPLNGRSLQALVQLVPGVVLTPLNPNGTATGGSQFSISGNRPTSNYWMIDGISANTGMSASYGGLPGAAGSGQTPGTTALGGTNNLVSLDALQEFRIETSTFAPEFGRTTGGQISLLTRSGTNQFHGSASYYLRNESLDANDWFADANHLPKPKERQNFFAGVFGGPIKRDRLFFFGSYEGLRLQQPKTTIVSVPTVALRSQAVPALLPYMNALPLPNGQDLGDGTAEFSASYTDPSNFDTLALKLDGKLTDNLTSFVRVSHGESEVAGRRDSLSTIGKLKTQNDSYTGGATWVATSRLTADARFNWTRNAPRYFNDLDNFGGSVVPRVSDIFRPGRNPSTAQFDFCAISGCFIWGPGTSDVQRQFNAVGVVAWSTGSHQVKAGVDYRRLLPLFTGNGGLFEALGFFTTQEVADAQAFYYQITNVDPVPREAIITNLSLYAQDTWHVSRRLTFTYGMRFERVPPPTEASGRIPPTLLGVESDVLQNPRLAPSGTSLWHSRIGEFAPRFGSAYQLRTRQGWETVLRGGVGIFYDLGLESVASKFQNLYPYLANKLLCCEGISFPLSNEDRTPPALVGGTPRGFGVFDPNWRLPYAAQWNISMEQGVGAAQLITIGYVGAKGYRLPIGQSYFQPVADWPGVPMSIGVLRNLGHSDYDALQLKYERRLRAGLQMLVSYTLGRSTDNASSSNSIIPPTSQADLIAREYGPSDFDVRNVFSAAVTYVLPKTSGTTLARSLVQDWALDLLVRYQSAFPINPTTGLTSLPDGRFFRTRPDVVPGIPLYLYGSQYPGGKIVNNTRGAVIGGCPNGSQSVGPFCAPPRGQQGNFPRNGLRGFPASQVDLALRREFSFGEKVRLQLRGELFNLFNHPNFGTPVADVTNGLFGRSTQMLNQSLGGLSALYQMGGPRSAQFGVKVLW